jgi:hypothetical protein
MMKKIMFVVVLLCLASTSFAQLFSGPSNTVGYVKIVAVGNPAPGIQTVSTPFGLPFMFWDAPAGGIPTYGSESTYPEDIAGDQLNCNTTALNSDRLLRPDNAHSAYRDSDLGCGWTGDLQTDPDLLDRMVPGHYYFYQNRTDANRNFVLAGQVENSGVDGGSYVGVLINNNQFNPYSWRDSRDRNRNDLNLRADGFTGGANALASDRVVIADGTGGNFWYSTTLAAWQGLAGIVPGAPYWIHNRNHVNGAWTYSYDATSGIDMVPVGPSEKETSAGSMAKVGANPKVQAGKSTARE